MAISSVSFQKTKSNSVAETTRQFHANYLLKEKYRKPNEYWNCGVDERELARREIAKRKYKHGKVPQVENSLWEGVLNLNENHTMSDVKKVCEHIEKKFNIINTRIAIHRDEGHYDIITGKVEYNIHAHINFETFKDGRQNWRRQFVNKKALAELQTEVAEILGMQRGQVNTTNTRVNHRHFRENAEEIKAQRKAQQELPSVLAKQKDLKEQNAKLRKELQQAHAKREQYAELEALNRELKQKIKNKELTIGEMEKKIQELQQKHQKQIDTVVSKFKEIAPDSKNITEAVEYVRGLEKENAELKNREPEVREVEKIVEKKIYVEVENPETEKQLISARERANALEEEKYTLMEDFSSYKQKYADVVTQNKELQENEIKFKENTIAYIKKELDTELDVDIKKENAMVQIIKKLVEQVKDLTQKLSEALMKNEEIEKNTTTDFQKMIKKMQKEQSKNQDQGYDLSL